MSSVNFGGPLNFGSATYGDSFARLASNDGVPANANVTAAVDAGQSLIKVAAVVCRFVGARGPSPGP